MILFLFKFAKEKFLAVTNNIQIPVFRPEREENWEVR